MQRQRAVGQTLKTADLGATHTYLDAHTPCLKWYLPPAGLHIYLLPTSLGKPLAN